MKIAIIGAGAMGAWLGVRLASAGHQVSVLARGETLQRLRNAPWRLETPGGPIEAPVAASDRPEELGRNDLVILAVKAFSLAAVAPMVAGALKEGGVVLPVMNGVPWWFMLTTDRTGTARRLMSVDPAGTIEAAIPLARVVGAVAHVSAASVAPGVVRQVGGNELIIGQPGSGSHARTQGLASALAAANVDVSVSNDIRQDIWYKLWGNMTINPMAAITGATADRVLGEPLSEQLVCRIMDEASAIGRAIGCEIREMPGDRNAVTRKLGAFVPSMLQDARAGRRMEIEALLEAPREIAQSAGIETPFLDSLLGLMRLFAAESR